MNNSLDSITKLINQCINLVFLSNPFRTSMGIILGVTIKEFTPIFSELTTNTFNLDISKISVLGWMTLCVFIFNFKFLIQKNSKISPEAERTFNLIQEARRAGISDIEIKQKYRFIIQQYADNLALNQKMQKELNAIKQQLNQQLRDKSN